MKQQVILTLKSIAFICFLSFGGCCGGGGSSSTPVPVTPSCGLSKIACIKSYTPETGWVRYNYGWSSACSDPNGGPESCNQYLLVYIADCPSGKIISVNRDFVGDFPPGWTQLEGETECRTQCPNPPTVPYAPCVQMRKD